MKESFNDARQDNFNLRQICEALDNDFEINDLLGKIFDPESGPQGEFIWPSNMVTLENGILIISGKEFDEMINEARQSAQEDNDRERILKIKELSRRKQEIILTIKNKLKELGYNQIEIKD